MVTLAIVFYIEYRKKQTCFGVKDHEINRIRQNSFNVSVEETCEICSQSFIAVH